MKYYFDTSVWIAYFDKEEFYHKEAVLWFEKIVKETHELYVSDLVDEEMGERSSFKDYPAMSRRLCIHSTVEREDREYARILSRKYRLPFKDIVHILHAKRNNFIAVSADITHWPKIARIIGFQSFCYISDIRSP